MKKNKMASKRECKLLDRLAVLDFEDIQIEKDFLKVKKEYKRKLYQLCKRRDAVIEKLRLGVVS